MTVEKIIRDIYTRVVSNVNLILDHLWILLHKEANISEDIIIAGTFRSGTTWLMEIVGTLKDYRFVFEPFHRAFYPRSKIFKNISYPPPWRPYVYYKEKNNLIYEYVYDFLRGRVTGRWYYSPNFLFKNIARAILADKVLVKITWGIRLIPWIAHHFKVKAIYLILRHPCAVIESWMRTGIGNPLSIYGIDVVKKRVLSQAKNIVELRDREDLFDFLRKLDRPEEILAAIYSIDYYVLTIYRNKGWYHIVFYENLLLNTDKELKRIFQYLNRPVPYEVHHIIKIPSFTTHEKSTIGTFKNLNKWRDRLSHQQIENIIKVVHQFDLTFYDKRPEPSKEW